MFIVTLKWCGGLPPKSRDLATMCYNNTSKILTHYHLVFLQHLEVSQNLDCYTSCDFFILYIIICYSILCYN